MKKIKLLLVGQIKEVERRKGTKKTEEQRELKEKKWENTKLRQPRDYKMLSSSKVSKQESVPNDSFSSIETTEVEYEFGDKRVPKEDFLEEILIN